MNKPLVPFCHSIHLTISFVRHIPISFFFCERTHSYVFSVSVDNATHVGAKSSDNFAIIAVITKGTEYVCLCACVRGYIYPVIILSIPDSRRHGVFQKYLLRIMTPVCLFCITVRISNIYCSYAALSQHMVIGFFGFHAIVWLFNVLLATKASVKKW